MSGVWGVRATIAVERAVVCLLTDVRKEAAPHSHESWSKQGPSWWKRGLGWWNRRERNGGRREQQWPRSVSRRARAELAANRVHVGKPRAVHSRTVSSSQAGMKPWPDGSSDADVSHPRYAKVTWAPLGPWGGRDRGRRRAGETLFLPMNQDSGTAWMPSAGGRGSAVDVKLKGRGRGSGRGEGRGHRGERRVESGGGTRTEGVGRTGRLWTVEEVAGDVDRVPSAPARPRPRQRKAQTGDCPLLPSGGSGSGNSSTSSTAAPAVINSNRRSIRWHPPLIVVVVAAGRPQRAWRGRPGYREVTASRRLHAAAQSRGRRGGHGDGLPRHPSISSLRPRPPLPGCREVMDSSSPCRAHVVDSPSPPPPQQLLPRHASTTTSTTTTLTAPPATATTTITTTTSTTSSTPRTLPPLASSHSTTTGVKRAADPSNAPAPGPGSRAALPPDPSLTPSPPLNNPTTSWTPINRHPQAPRYPLAAHSHHSLPDPLQLPPIAALSTSHATAHPHALPPLRRLPSPVQHVPFAHTPPECERSTKRARLSREYAPDSLDLYPTTQPPPSTRGPRNHPASPPSPAPSPVPASMMASATHLRQSMHSGKSTAPALHRDNAESAPSPATYCIWPPGTSSLASEPAEHPPAPQPARDALSMHKNPISPQRNQRNVTFDLGRNDVRPLATTGSPPDSIISMSSSGLVQLSRAAHYSTMDPVTHQENHQVDSNATKTHSCHKCGKLYFEPYPDMSKYKYPYRKTGSTTGMGPSEDLVLWLSDFRRNETKRLEAWFNEHECPVIVPDEHHIVQAPWPDPSPGVEFDTSVRRTHLVDSDRGDIRLSTETDKGSVETPPTVLSTPSPDSRIYIRSIPRDNTDTKWISMAGGKAVVSENHPLYNIFNHAISPDPQVEGTSQDGTHSNRGRMTASPASKEAVLSGTPSNETFNQPQAQL
ncbi:hypothetical protein EJ04DRAFT_590481 [Polyplosphaeria fusca]|uniref:Uncharacterized protein n=1 Tax=Polyplosphaeria fusca TaxID=682080 RepID=A0A9P4R6R9_9PLEO|nr:hypothetical protein EJ04DRAFT_590481 [Polyplosphaeria fusca]